MVHLPDEVRDELESLPDVVGIGRTPRRAHGQSADESVVAVFVADDRQGDAAIPERIEVNGETVQTDVRPVDGARAESMADSAAERTASTDGTGAADETSETGEMGETGTRASGADASADGNRFQSRVETNLRAQYGDDVVAGDDADFRVEAWPVRLAVVVADGDDMLDTVARAMAAADDAEGERAHPVVVYPRDDRSGDLRAIDGVTLVPLSVESE